MSLEEQLERLNYRFMSVDGYAAAARSGKLPHWPVSRSELRPGQMPRKHPMNNYNVNNRMRASWNILELAERDKSLFTDDVLKTIHDHIFDCAPGVRHNLVKVLYHVGNKSSIPHLGRLLDIETAGELPNTGVENVIRVAYLVHRKLKPNPAFRERTIFLLSPNISLALRLWDFCANNRMYIRIGDPNSSDFTAIDFKVGIVTRDSLDEKSWNKWIEFLKANQGKVYDYLLVIILNSEIADTDRQKLEKHLEEINKPVFFATETEVGHIISSVRRWLKNGHKPTEDVRPCEETTDNLTKNDEIGGDTTFRDQLIGLIYGFPTISSGTKVNLQDYSNWRMRAKWLLANFLGEQHLYTRELDKMLGEIEPFPAPNILLAKGVLEALRLDFNLGLVKIKEKL